jgi:uncharacterized protein (TIGR00369 family)
MLKFLNASLIEFKTDHVSLKLPKQEFMTRKSGIFNGAMKASLVDISSGSAAINHFEEDCYVVTVELKINYLRPALGDFLSSKSYVIKGGRLSVIHTEIYAQNEGEKIQKHVATSLVTMMKIN